MKKLKSGGWMIYKERIDMGIDFSIFNRMNGFYLCLASCF